jgi:uncharacterized protein with NRDE domain
MCTLVILYRPDHEWPVIIGANRDEMADRPWSPPGRHWDDRPDVVAGLDELAGGSWLGVNDEGVVAAINNRAGSLGTETDKRSRGELVLEALDHYTAADAAEALADLDPVAYRAFNLIIADRQDAFWLRNVGGADTTSIDVTEIEAGVSMITAHDINDFKCPRIRANLALFRMATEPDPANNNWTDWETLLAKKEYDSNDGSENAMLIATDHGFNTLSSSLIAIPSLITKERKPVWRFARRYPKVESYEEVRL